jgi:hypothetical protein
MDDFLFDCCLYAVHKGLKFGELTPGCAKSALHCAAERRVLTSCYAA